MTTASDATILSHAALPLAELPGIAHRTLAGREHGLHLAGRVHAFGAETSVLLPRDVPHQIFNVGQEPMEITGVFPSAPVRVFDLQRQPMALPW